MENSNKAKLLSIFETVKASAHRYSGRFVDCDDLVQFTMEKILRARCLPHAPSEKWVLACIFNARNDLLRRVYRERESRDFFQPLDSIGLTYDEDNYSIVPQFVYEASDPYLVRAIEIAIGKLSSAHKKVFCLHVDGYTYAQISRVTDCNINTVRSRLFFAKSSLRKSLAEHR